MRNFQLKIVIYLFVFHCFISISLIDIYFFLVRIILAAPSISLISLVQNFINKYNQNNYVV